MGSGPVVIDAQRGDDATLFSVCLLFLIAIVVSILAVVLLRLTRTPRWATPTTVTFTPRTPWLPRPEPDALGVSRT